MAKPSTPAVWASGKAFGFQPSAAQQAQGFDYIANVRPTTGAPITDDHDWPLNNITNALKWLMDQIPDGAFTYASSSPSNGYFNTPGSLVQTGVALSDSSGSAKITFQIPFPRDYIIIGIHSGTGPAIVYEVYTSHGLNDTTLKISKLDGTPPTSGAQIKWIAVMVKS